MELRFATKDIVDEALSGVVGDSGTKSEETNVEQPSTSRARLQPNKKAGKKSIKPLTGTNHDFENGSTVTYSRQRIPCKICKKVCGSYCFNPVYFDCLFRR